jgi:hypothetical protein
MKLNVNERLIIVGVIPEKGTFKTLNTVDKLRRILHLNEEESIKYELQQKGDQLSWNKLGIERVEVDISELGFELIMESFENLDKNENLSIIQFPIFKYFKEFKEEMDKPKEEKPEDKI